MSNLLKQMLREKYSYKREAEINAMTDKVVKGSIDESLWRKILEKMYDAADLRAIMTILERDLQ